MQPILLLQELALERLQMQLVVVAHALALVLAVLEGPLDVELVPLEVGEAIELVARLAQLTRELLVLCRQLIAHAVELRVRRLPLVLALRGKELALLVDRLPQRLDELILALRILAQELEHQLRVVLLRLLLFLQLQVLSHELLAAEAKLFERSLLGFQMDALHVAGDHFQGAATGRSHACEGSRGAMDRRGIGAAVASGAGWPSSLHT